MKTLFVICVAAFTISCKHRNPDNVRVVGGQMATSPFRSTILLLLESYDLPNHPETGALRLPRPDYPLAPNRPKIVVAFCSGAILQGGYVMTAAHCVLNSDKTVADGFKKGVKFWVTNAIDLTDAVAPKLAKKSFRYLDLAKTNAVELTVLTEPRVQQSYLNEMTSVGETAAPDIAVIKVTGAQNLVAAKLANTRLQDGNRVAFGGYGCRTEQERNRIPTESSAKDGSLPVMLRIDEDVEVLDTQQSMPSANQNYRNNYFLSPKTESQVANADSSTCFGDSGMPIYRKDENIIVGVHGGSLKGRFVSYHARVDTSSLGGQWLRHILPASLFKN